MGLGVACHAKWLVWANCAYMGVGGLKVGRKNGDELVSLRGKNAPVSGSVGKTAAALLPLGYRRELGIWDGVLCGVYYIAAVCPVLSWHSL